MVFMDVLQHAPTVRALLQPGIASLPSPDADDGIATAHRPTTLGASLSPNPIGVECEDTEARLSKQICVAVAQPKSLGRLPHRVREDQRASRIALDRPPQPGEGHAIGNLEGNTLPIGLNRAGWPDPGDFELAEEGFA